MPTRKPFRIQPGTGGLEGHAARLHRAASGADNARRFAWQDERKYQEGGVEGAFLIAIPFDDFEGYPNFLSIDGTNGGYNWNSQPWVARANFAGIQASEDFENYIDGSYNGAELGFGFSGPAVTRENYIGAKDIEDFEGIADGNPLNGENTGTGFAGPWVARSL